MDVLIVVLLFSVASATATGVIVTYNMRQNSQPMLRRRKVYTKWLIPEPGKNFELYTHVCQVWDELDAERKAALLESDDLRRERDKAIAERDAAYAECERYRTKLVAAQDVVRNWTHSRIKLLPEEVEVQEREVVTTI